MRFQMTLTSSESKRLIAKGVRALPCVKRAMVDKHIIVSGGTTNAFVLSELVGEEIEKKSRYTIGVITDGKTGVSDVDDRIPPYVIGSGKVMDKDFNWKDYLKDIKRGDVFIKGGNAVDPSGLAGVLASNNMAGTVGVSWGPLIQRGIDFIVPVGLEKLVPDVRGAVEFLSSGSIDEAIGDRVALMPLLGAKVVTEITALEVLYGVEARCIAAGGINGSEGAVVIVIDGDEAKVKEAIEGIKVLKGEPQVK